MKKFLFIIVFIALLFTVVLNINAQDNTCMCIQNKPTTGFQFTPPSQVKLQQDLSYTPQPNDKFAWTYQGYEGRSKVFHVKVFRNDVPLPQIFEFVINYDSEDVMYMLEDSYTKYNYIPVIEKEYFMFYILSEDGTRISIIRYQNYSKYSSIIRYVEQEAHIFIGN